MEDAGAGKPDSRGGAGLSGQWDKWKETEQGCTEIRKADTLRGICFFIVKNSLAYDLEAILGRNYCNFNQTALPLANYYLAAHQRENDKSDGFLFWRSVSEYSIGVKLKQMSWQLQNVYSIFFEYLIRGRTFAAGNPQPPEGIPFRGSGVPG